MVNEATDPVTKVARDLTEIEQLTAHLFDEAVNKANHYLMPGGYATVSLAHVSNIEAWENIYEMLEGAGRDATHVLDEDDTWEPPLQTLCYWSEKWRTIHGYELDGPRASIASEANFIRWCLNWALENEPEFQRFASDINKARVRLENLVHAGIRQQRTRVNCANETCERRPRLYRTWGAAQDGSEDGYKCPACKHRYSEDDFMRAYARQLRSEGAAKFVPLTDATDTLRALGRSERTIRKWFTDCEVESFCDPESRKTMIWWPDLWRLHLSTPTRRRAS